MIPICSFLESAFFFFVYYINDELPTRSSQNNFLVILAVIWVIRIMNDEWTAEAIWILTTRVRMIPVSARLVDLQKKKN